MKNKAYKTLILASASVLVLTGCSGAKEQLGLTRQAPDEFAVVKRAPLEMPPDYTLRPPQPGAQRPQETSQDKEAREAVFGKTQTTRSATPDSAEEVLLQKTGADTANDSIRRIVDQEATKVEEKDKPVAEKLLGWTGLSSSSKNEVIDPKEEAERLKKQKEAENSATATEQPTEEE